MMQSPILSFVPVYKDYIWGGSKIATLFNRPDAPKNCGESWEISGHKDGMSIVRDGRFAGKTLEELCLIFGRDLLGRKAKRTDRFPLLTKIIDANRALSVQIHPSKADPEANEDEIKNECWHSLGASASSSLYAGFKDGVRPERLRDVMNSADTRVDTLLSCMHPKEGQTIFIPAGLVHAIGRDCLIYEVQQSSNTTYRLYDWGHITADGGTRPLHIPQAMRSIDWSLAKPTLEDPRPLAGSKIQICTSNPFFTLMRFAAETPEVMNTRGESFHAIFISSGEFQISTQKMTTNAVKGKSLLIPACAGQYSLTPKVPNSAALIATL